MKSLKGYRVGAAEEDGVPARIVGVFLDWSSMFQDKPKGLRTPEQLAVFQNALKSINIWYAHQKTLVWMLNHLPPDQPANPAWTDDQGVVHPAKVRCDYDNSGWTTFERSISQILKHPGDLLDVTLEKRQKWLMEAAPEDEPEVEFHKCCLEEWTNESDEHKRWAIQHGGDFLRLVVETMDMKRGTPDEPDVFNGIIRTKTVTNGNVKKKRTHS